MMNKSLKTLVATLGMTAWAGTALAVLTAVDPGPYTAGSGYFPVWYDDGTTNLEFCHSRALSSRVPPVYRTDLHVHPDPEPARLRRHPAGRVPGELAG